MNVLIINAYSIFNAGDCAIITCMADIVRKEYPDCNITVMSPHHEENEEFYLQRKMGSVLPIWEMPTESRFSRYRKAIGYFFGAWKRSPNLPAMKEADLVLAAGGGYLFSTRNTPLGLGLVGMAWHMKLATRLGKPCLLFPQSVGPFFWQIDRVFVAGILRKLTHVFTREAISTKIVRDLGVTHVTECPDVVFTMQPEPLPKYDALVSKGSPKIGISMVDWRSTIKGTTESDIEAYVTRVADTLKELHKTHPNLHAYIYPHCHLNTTGEFGNDWGVSNRLHEKCPEISTIVDVSHITSPEELSGLYGKMDAYIATRMHASIFALCANVPTLALAYQPKTLGTFRLLDLSDLTLPVDTFTTEEAVGVLRKCLEQSDEVRSRAKAAISRCKKEIYDAILPQLKRAVELESKNCLVTQ